MARSAERAIFLSAVIQETWEVTVQAARPSAACLICVYGFMRLFRPLLHLSTDRPGRM